MLKASKLSISWSKLNIYIILPNKRLENPDIHRELSKYMLVCFTYTSANQTRHP